uniref:Uncharacterized protein n=1 Tax=Lygus hesperus TaxID=30085 RepID=A0A146ME73_LYGHE
MTELQNSFKYNRHSKELEVHNAQIELWKAQARLYSHIAVADIVEMHPSMVHQLPFTRTLAQHSQVHVVGTTYVLGNWNVRLGTLFVRKKRRIPETVFLEVELHSPLALCVQQEHFTHVFETVVPHAARFQHHDCVLPHPLHDSVSSCIHCYFVSSLHFPLFTEFQLPTIFDARHAALLTAFSVQNAPVLPPNATAATTATTTRNTNPTSTVV